MANWSEGPLLSRGLPSRGGPCARRGDNEDSHTCTKLSKGNKSSRAGVHAEAPRPWHNGSEVAETLGE